MVLDAEGSQNPQQADTMEMPSPLYPLGTVMDMEKVLVDASPEEAGAIVEEILIIQLQMHPPRRLELRRKHALPCPHPPCAEQGKKY